MSFEQRFIRWGVTTVVVTAMCPTLCGMADAAGAYVLSDVFEWVGIVGSIYIGTLCAIGCYALVAHDVRSRRMPRVLPEMLPNVEAWN